MHDVSYSNNITDSLILLGDKRYVNEVAFVFGDKAQRIYDDEFYKVNQRMKNIVVCSYDAERITSLLNGMGLYEGVNFIYAKDFVRKFDNVRLPIRLGERKIAIWGCGRQSDKIIQNDIVHCYIDSKKHGGGYTKDKI